MLFTSFASVLVCDQERKLEIYKTIHIFLLPPKMKPALEVNTPVTCCDIDSEVSKTQVCSSPKGPVRELHSSATQPGSVLNTTPVKVNPTPNSKIICMMKRFENIKH